MSSTLTKLCSALALTATLSYADKLSMGELMKLQSEMLDHLDLGHAEPEVDDHEDHQDEQKHSYHEEHFGDAENELEWETIHEVSGGMKCKEGFTKIGCCKCVHDDHVSTEHTSVPEIKTMPLAYHGIMEPPASSKPSDAGPHVMPKANDPNLASWFTKQTDTDKETKSTSQQKTKSSSKTTEDDDYKKDTKKEDQYRGSRDQTDSKSAKDKDDEKDSKTQKHSKDSKKDDERSTTTSTKSSYDSFSFGDSKKQQKQQKQHFSMSTSEEQARGKTTPKSWDDQRQESKKDVETSKKASSKKDDEDDDNKKKQDADKKTEQEARDEKASQCPEGFVYETRKRQDQAPWIVEACRMPMSYDLEIDDQAGHGVEHHLYRHSHSEAHYSYGRWLDQCSTHFVRNGCCTCTPHCPDGMIMDSWKTASDSKSNFVCLILSADEY